MSCKREQAATGLLQTQKCQMKSQRAAAHMSEPETREKTFHYSLSAADTHPDRLGAPCLQCARDLYPHRIQNPGFTVHPESCSPSAMF